MCKSIYTHHGSTSTEPFVIKTEDQQGEPDGGATEGRNDI